MWHRLFAGGGGLGATGALAATVAAVQVQAEQNDPRSLWIAAGVLWIAAIVAFVGWLATKPEGDAAATGVHAAGAQTAVSRSQSGGITATNIGALDQSVRLAAPTPDPLIRFDALIDAVHDYEKAVRAEASATLRFGRVDHYSHRGKTEYQQRWDELESATKEEARAREALKRQASRNGTVVELRAKVDAYLGRCSASVPSSGGGTRDWRVAMDVITTETNTLIDWLNQNARPR